MGRDISRRALIIGGTVAATSAMLATGLSSCADEQQDTTVDEEIQELREYPTLMHDVDILIVGGGISGCFAAMRALQLGSTVAVVDKGQYGHSGTSGYNWGHMYTSYDETSDVETSTQEAVVGKIRGGSGVSDQDIAATLGTRIIDMKLTHLCESLGMFHERLEDGTPGTCFMGEPYGSETNRLTQGIYCRFINQKVKKMGAQIFDRTFFLDVLVGENGEATGGVALDLRDGTVHVFRAKSVIMAMGSYNWICGWLDWRPQTMCGPECTGDAYSILMKRGVPVGNFEFCATDNNAYNPGAFRVAYGLGLEFPDADRAINSEGRSFVLEYMAEHSDQAGIEMLEQLVAGEVYHGRGSEHGGVWLDIAGFGGQEMEVFYRRTPENMLKNFGYTFPDKVEVVPDPWASFCAPKVDTSMQTAIPGLYFAGYPVVTCGVEGCAASGQIAGESAAQRAAENERVAPDWEQVNDVIEHAFELLEREPDDGMSATQVMREIQVAYGEGLGLLRDEEGIQNALDEFTRIKEEDIPRMYVPNKSKVMNLEWRRAFEAENMVNVAIAVAMASLERRESRFMHIRTDYPAINNDEYMKRFMVSMDGDEFSIAAEDVDMSMLDAETVASMVPSTNINSYNDMIQE